MAVKNFAAPAAHTARRVFLARAVSTRQRTVPTHAQRSAAESSRSRHHRRSILLSLLLAATAAATPKSFAQGGVKDENLAPIKSVIVDHYPSPEMLQLLAVDDWAVWTCEASKVRLTYQVDEDCYMMEGDAVIIPEKGPQVEIRAGDFVTFPKGFACVWDVKKPVKKRYKQVAVLADERPFKVAAMPSGSPIAVVPS